MLNLRKILTLTSTLILSAVVSFAIHSQSLLKDPIVETVEQTTVAAEGPNSSDLGIIMTGSLGYSSAIFGSVYHSTDVDNIGGGPSIALQGAVMGNFRQLAAELALDYNILNKLENTIGGVKTERTGTGRIMTFDARFGVKLMRKPGDMGYLFAYAGPRFLWTSYNLTETNTTLQATGNSFKDETTKKTSGDLGGFVIGVRDISTLPMGDESLLITIGAQYSRTPVKKIETDGIEVKTYNTQSAGFGLNLGAGMAYEESGLAWMINLKYDATASVFQITENGKDSLFATGYSGIFAVVTKEMAF